MFIINALLFLISLPFRIIGTLLGWTIRITGCFITLLSDLLGFIFRILGTVIVVLSAGWLLFGLVGFSAVHLITNWVLYGLISLGIGVLIIYLAEFGDWLGDVIMEKGDDLFLFSWRMTTL